MAYTPSSRRAVDKYVKTNYESFTLRVKKGEKEKIQTHAQGKGMSLNAYIQSLIYKDMEGEK